MLEELTRKAKRKTPAGSSSMDRLIYNLADIYTKYSGKRAGVALINDAPDGPFVRFVTETAQQFGVKAPGGHAVNAALDKYRHQNPPKHVIGALKMVSE